MPNEELKPCPFCGGTVEIKTNYKNQFYVLCKKCEAVVWVGYNCRHKASVITAWNRRAEDGIV